MRYRVELLPAAERALSKLPPDAQSAVIARMEALGRAPRGEGTRKLSGEQSLYRARAGAYRILYQIADDVLLVLG